MWIALTFLSLADWANLSLKIKRSKRMIAAFRVEFGQAFTQTVRIHARIRSVLAYSNGSSPDDMTKYFRRKNGKLRLLRMSSNGLISIEDSHSKGRLIASPIASKWTNSCPIHLWLLLKPFRSVCLVRKQLLLDRVRCNDSLWIKMNLRQFAIPFLNRLWFGEMRRFLVQVISDAVVHSL
jgi:hypothetical protein